MILSQLSTVCPPLPPQLVSIKYSLLTLPIPPRKILPIRFSDARLSPTKSGRLEVHDGGTGFHSCVGAHSRPRVWLRSLQKPFPPWCKNICLSSVRCQSQNRSRLLYLPVAGPSDGWGILSPESTLSFVCLTALLPRSICMKINICLILSKYLSSSSDEVSDCHGRPSYGTCFGHPTRCDLSIPDNTYECSSMVLCLRNTCHRYPRYSPAFAHVYQVAHRPQNGFDRLFDITLELCHATSNENIDITISAFVSYVERDEVFTIFLT